MPGLLAAHARRHNMATACTRRAALTDRTRPEPGFDSRGWFRLPVMPVRLDRVQHRVGRVMKPILSAGRKIACDSLSSEASQVNIGHFISHGSKQLLVIMFFGQF